MSAATFYKWRSKYGGMDALLMSRMKELEAENAHLKKAYAEVQLQNDVIKETMFSPICCHQNMRNKNTFSIRNWFIPKSVA